MDKWLSHNNVAKVIALIVSIILWAMVHLDSGTPVAPTPVVNTKVIPNVKIQIVGFDSDNYVLSGLETDKVRLEVRGKRTDITTNFSDYKVKLDLSNVGPGTSSQPLTHELPPGVQLVSMSPSIVKVTIEAKQTKDVAVNIITKGQPAQGLQLGTPVVAGSGIVKVTLPESELAELERVQGVVDISGISEPVKGKSVKLTAYDKQGQEMRNALIVPSSVDVDIPVSKLYKSVPLEVREVGQLPDGLVVASVESDVKGVAIYGSKEVLEGISSYSVAVDLSQFKGTNQTRYTVDLTPPEGSEKIEPSSVTVTVKVEPPGQREISGIPITLKQDNPQLAVTILDPSDKRLSLTVVGAKEIIDNLKPEDIKITADISGLGPGPHMVPLDIALPLHVSLAEGDSSRRISVEIAEKSEPAVTEPEEHQDSTPANDSEAGVPPSENAGGSGAGTNAGGGEQKQ
ncbi:CdaR family protein [Paenibacillus ihumii]|uniref:CdaR family protein n=1 Tax=Paenibacillus ihumii TaxID=687436 RepID=UPI0006D84EDC|nr:CdaR family protein [Paenibacillus ihumii]